MSDGKLIALHLERDELLPEAAAALDAEIRRRSLTKLAAAALAQRTAADRERTADTADRSVPASQPDDGPKEAVFHAFDESQALLVHGLLESHGIPATIERMALLGGIIDLAEKRLLVASERAAEARQLIADAERRGAQEEIGDAAVSILGSLHRPTDASAGDVPAGFADSDADADNDEDGDADGDGAADAGGDWD